MISPILPLWLVIPITIALLVVTIINSKNIKLIIRILMIVLLFIVNLRIKIPNGEIKVLKNNLDVIFVVDVTLSMDALDYNGKTRLSGVINDLTYVVNELNGANFSLISFDNIINVVPLTSDNNTIKAGIATLSTPDSLYAKGSSITIFKEELERILKSSKKKNNRKRIVFIVTDGENTTDDKLESLTDLRDLVDDGAVLGYGTTTGGKMRVETYRGSGYYEYVKDRSDYSYKDAISKIDETNLKKMANELDIEYIHMEKRSNINSRLNKIARSMSYEGDSSIEYAYQDIYYFIAPLLIVLFIVELVMDRRLHQ